MTRYITNGVLVRLHYQKAGQHSSRRKAQAFMLGILCLVVIPLVIYNQGGGGETPNAIYRIVPPVFGSLGGPPTSGAPPSSSVAPSSASFPTGYVGPVRIVAENRDPITIQVKLPESSQLQLPTPEVPYSFDGNGVGSGEPSEDHDFGLPRRPPLWSYRSRGLPSGMVDQKATLPALTSQAHAMLNNPIWPDDVWMVDDTAVVEGWLTMHSYGLMSFKLISETPPGQGFGAAVQNAIERGQCIPARDSLNNRTTVRCRYRCLFFHGGEPAVSVGIAVSARVRK